MSQATKHKGSGRHGDEDDMITVTIRLHGGEVIRKQVKRGTKLRELLRSLNIDAEGEKKHNFELNGRALTKNEEGLLEADQTLDDEDIQLSVVLAEATGGR